MPKDIDIPIGKDKRFLVLYKPQLKKRICPFKANHLEETIGLLDE